jgi:AraC family transcriptional regulator
VVEPIAAEDLPKWVPGTLLRRSDDLGWKGVKLRSWAYRGQDVEIPPMRDFLLVAYQVGTTPMQRRFDGRWSRTTCGPGAVSLLTRSQKSHWHWTEDVDVTHLYLSQDFVSEVAVEVSGRSVADVALADVLRADDPQMAHAIAAISAEVDERGLGGPLYVDAVARQLVILLLRRYAALSFRLRDPDGMLTAAQRRTALDFIDANLGESLHLDAIAVAVNLGVCTFARQFRRTLGATPHAYVMARRLDRARRLLAETVMPAKEVAAACGFADQAHLTRLFSRRFATTPAAFRKGTRAGATPLTDA